MTILELIFVLSNIAIFFGYLFVATTVAPNFSIKLERTRWAGILFFLTCGLTHFELAIHMALEEDITLPEMTSWHMISIHIVQAFAVWFFVLGLYDEFVKGERQPIIKETDS